MSIQNILSGTNAFYSAADYESVTKKEFAQSAPPPPCYRVDLESRVWRVAKFIFSLLLFPIALYNLLHSLIGLLILPACPMSYYRRSDIDDARCEFFVDPDRKVKRISLLVDGTVVDVMIIGTEKTLGNGRWILFSGDNGELYEGKMGSWNDDFRTMSDQFNASALVFNYPSVGASGGILPSKEIMVKAYRAMLLFLEDKNEGLGADLIIGYGHSLGGGVQAEALLSHTLKSDIQYLFIKSRTFATLSGLVSDIMHPILGFLVNFSGWNMDCYTSSKQLQAPEIILQTSHDRIILQTSKNIQDDGSITSFASLGKAILDDTTLTNRHKKTVLGVWEYHDDSLGHETVNRIIDQANRLLQPIVT